MKTFQELQEDRGEKAYKQAIGMGLKYGGFGYWKDPQTNKTVYKTENDTLVKVEPEEESELANKRDEPGGAAEAGGGAMGAPGGGMTNAAGMLQMPGAGGAMPGQGILGAPEPGQEQAPKENEWEPGPDGDTCVGADAEQPGEVEKDSYVGRTNYLKWTAGADGDNMNTVDFDMVKESNITEGERTELGSDYVSLNTKQKKANSDRLDKGKNRADKVQDILKGKERSPAGDATKDELRSKARFTNNSDSDQRLNAKLALKDYAGAGSMTRSRMKKQDAGYRKASGQDKKTVTDMNDNLQRTGILSQPDFDMQDTMDNGQYLGEGAFGKVMMSPDKKTVVKEGEIGMEELEALGTLKNHPNFPTLLNGEFTSPFYHESEVRGLESGRSGGFDPEDYDSDDFMKRHPTAEGRYAMSAAAGRELSDAHYDIKNHITNKDEANAMLQRGVHNVFADMHRRGVAHNDRHGGNILADYDIDDDGKFTLNDINVLDLGLAQNDHFRALKEALGGYTGEDYQLSSRMRPDHDDFDEDLGYEIDSNYEKMMGRAIEMHDEYRQGDDYDDDQRDIEHETLRHSVSSPLRGGIREGDSTIEGEAEEYEWLSDDNNVKELIDLFYGNMGTKGKTLQDRMSRGYDDAVDSIGTDQGMKPGQAKKMISVVNKMRKSKGQSRLKMKGLDYDD